VVARGTAWAPRTVLRYFPDKEDPMRGVTRFRIVGFALLAVLLLALPTAVVQAQEPAPGNLADVWIFWPEPGHEADFEAAAKAHIAWRKGAGDPFRWEAFQPVVGDDLTYYVFRSEGHRWEDFDANDAWGMTAKAGEAFDRDVRPYVARFEHHIDEVDVHHTRWTDSEDYRLFTVVELHLQPGAHARMTEALDKVHKAAMDGNWPGSYAVLWSHGGSGAMIVVYPYKSWADMKEPDPPFIKVLAQSVGSMEAAGAVLTQLGGSFEDEHTTVYAARPDLSTPK
jgi:hypothetical protein